MPKKRSGLSKEEKEELKKNELRRKYKPVHRKLKSTSRAYAIMKNLKHLSGKSTDILDNAARNLSNSLQSINDLARILCEPDESGVYPQMTEENLLQLNQLYSKALQECNTMMKGENFSDEVKNSQKYKSYLEMVTMTRKYLAADYKYLETANAKLGETLPEAISNARTVVLKAGSAQFDKLGQSQSARLPMTVSLAGGKKVKGLFTKKDDFNPVAEYNALLDSLAVDPSMKTFINNFRLPKGYDDFDNILQHYISLMVLHHRNAPEQRTFLQELTALTGKSGQELRDLPGFEDALAAIGQNKDQLMQVFEDNTTRLYTRMNVNYKQAGMRSGNLDTKNAACSIIASLLGRSDLVANSVPVKMEQNGVSVEGTFMEFVEGIDLTRIGSDVNDPKNDPYYSLSIKKGVDHSSGLKNIFDLEIFDYVVGNIDCHGGNVLYDIKKNPQTSEYELKGLKRIDLDNTFIENEIDEKGLHNLGSAENMKVISSSMARCIEALNEDTLRLALRGHMKSEKNPDGLSELAVDRMIERVNDIKSRITYNTRDLEPGKLRVMKDGDWKNYSLTDLVQEAEGNNITGTSKDVLAWLTDKSGVRKEAQERELKQANAGKHELKLPEVAAESKEKAKSVDYKKMERELTKVEKDLADATIGVWFGSDKYKNMHNKAKEILTMLKEHNGNPAKKGAGFDKKISDALIEFKDKTELYLERKRGQGQKAANDEKSMKRITAAVKTSNFIDKYSNRIEIKNELKNQVANKNKNAEQQPVL